MPALFSSKILRTETRTETRIYSWNWREYINWAVAKSEYGERDVRTAGHPKEALDAKVPSADNGELPSTSAHTRRARPDTEEDARVIPLRKKRKQSTCVTVQDGGASQSTCSAKPESAASQSTCRDKPESVASPSTCRDKPESVNPLEKRSRGHVWASGARTNVEHTRGAPVVDERRRNTRQDCIEKWKGMYLYQRYLTLVPKNSRTSDDPASPDAFADSPKRAWKYAVEKWRRDVNDRVACEDAHKGGFPEWR
eukprot:GEMP01073385.1.p2 GENE.GEMP01073385.1~~GEMP01073385.1.p2  ORF type:complete len:254 (+),score=54.21 GEMP01073385.1:223-984(+)